MSNDLSCMTIEQLRAELGAARRMFTEAQYQDSHRQYVDLSAAADARIMRAQNEIALREAHHEAIHGR